MLALLATVLPVVAQTSEVSVAGAAPPKGAPLPWPVAASLSGPTDRYPHNVLGDIPAFTSLTVSAQVCADCPQPRVGLSVTLDAPLVFEDAAPRLWDITGDGRPEIVVVQSHDTKGARLTAWELGQTASGAPDLKMLTSTDFIGTRFRWLAPFGIGDFTGDGAIDERLHLRLQDLEPQHHVVVLPSNFLVQSGMNHIRHVEDLAVEDTLPGPIEGLAKQNPMGPPVVHPIAVVADALLDTRQHRPKPVMDPGIGLLGQQRPHDIDAALLFGRVALVCFTVDLGPKNRTVSCRPVENPVIALGFRPGRLQRDPLDLGAARRGGLFHRARAVGRREHSQC